MNPNINVIMFEFVLHFVECDTVTVSPNQIIIIIIIIIIIMRFHHISKPRQTLDASFTFVSSQIDWPSGKKPTSTTQHKFSQWEAFILFCDSIVIWNGLPEHIQNSNSSTGNSFFNCTVHENDSRDLIGIYVLCFGLGGLCSIFGCTQDVTDASFTERNGRKSAFIIILTGQKYEKKQEKKQNSKLACCVNTSALLWS